MLLVPVVSPPPALLPKAVFDPAVVFENKAFAPQAVLSPPSVFELKAL